MSTTELDLDAIEARHKNAVRANVQTQSFRVAQSLADLSNLLAEVRRLQTEIERLKGNQNDNN